MQRSALVLACALLWTAGCVGDAADAATAAQEAESDLDRASIADGTLVPVSLDGFVGTQATACAAPLGCRGEELPPGSDRIFPLEIDGRLTGLSVELSWEAATPAMSALRFGITWGADETSYEFVEGSSPLVLELSGLSVPPDAEPRLWVWTPNRAPPGEAYVTHDQPFHLEGALTVTA